MAPRINIYNPITEKDTKVDPYGRTAKNIYRIYIDDLGNDPATILPDNLTYINGRFIKVKPVVDVNNVRRITYNKVAADIGPNNSTMPFFKKVLKTYAGQTIKVVRRYSEINVDIDFDLETGEDIESVSSIQQLEDAQIWDIPVQGFSQWWNSQSNFFWIDSEREVFGEWNAKYLDDPKLRAQLLILTLDKVKGEQFDQYFLDGISHCFFQPIRDWANRCEEESESKSAKKRYKSMDKKIEGYINKYRDGIPEEDLVLVCNDLQVSVDIDLPSTIQADNKFIQVESQKKALKKFRFINTRLNHIELNEVSNKDEYIEVSKEEIIDIYNDSREKGEFILWKEGKNGVTQINSLNQIYKLKDENSYNEIVKNFEMDIDFNQYKIEKNANPELTNFLHDGLNTNQSINLMDLPELSQDYINEREPIEKTIQDLMNDLGEGGYLELFRRETTPEYNFYEDKKKILDFIDKKRSLNHIDIRKAYTQGHNCIMYQGYLGKVTDFRKTNKIVGLGIYKIKNINFNGSVIEKMNCLHENHNYPSPELEFYQILGITFDIVMGCWGSSFKFEFPESMYQKEGGISHYCKWYGCLMKLNEKERYNFDCKNIQFAELNAFNSPDSIRYNKDEDAGVIEYNKKYVYHSYHVASFIASYSRITLLEQILKFNDFNQIAYVVVDGIYFIGDVEVGPLFSKKEKKSITTFSDSKNYVYNYNFSDIEYETMGEFRENNKIEVHLGAGGCGKTHEQLVDLGLVSPLYVAPSWKLARNKKSEYNIDSSVFFYLLDSDPDKWRPLMRHYSVFIIDEISMLSEEDKTKILDRFPEHKIIFCGDVGFQLDPIEGKEFKVGDLPVFHHTTNYRCKCKELEKRLLMLRNMISKKYDNVNCLKIIEKFGFNVASEFDYNVEDMIITNTNATKDIYTEKYKHLEKYMVLENTRDFCNGNIVIGPKPEKVKCELRHGYTIYSAQGETAKNKLFIDVDKLNSLKLLYTAMSRCKTMDQIQFVKIV